MTATALKHPDMVARECLTRAVAEPDLDGRFYTPVYEELPTVQAELVAASDIQDSSLSTRVLFGFPK